MSIKPLVESCGCVSDIGNGITFCPKHRAAPEMFAELSAIAAQNEGLCGCVRPGADYPSKTCGHCRIRALVARAEGR